MSINALSSSAPLSKPNNYKYNGKEEQTEFNLNWYDYSARNYDAQLGRWFNIDPLAEDYYTLSPYQYVMNNPMKYVDPDGMSTHVLDNGDGTYKVVGGNAEDDDTNIYIVTQNDDGTYSDPGESIGESLTTHSFFYDDGSVVDGAIIDTNSTEGQDFLDELIEDNPGLYNYMVNATGGEYWDLKDRGIDGRPEGTTKLQYRYRGSKTKDGKIGSARDFGNVGAGIISSRKAPLSWKGARTGFDALESVQKGEIAEEALPTQLAQEIGFMIGKRLRSMDRAKTRRTKKSRNGGN